MSDLLNGFNNGRDKSDGIGGNKPDDYIVNGDDTSQGKALHKHFVITRFHDNASSIREKKKQIKQALKEIYGINTSNRWLDKYIFFFSKHIYPLENITTVDAITIIYSDIENFAYFIYGMRVNSNGL